MVNALRPIAVEQIMDVMLASMIYADVITRRRDGDEKNRSIFRAGSLRVKSVM
jgi:hypothetical protein